MNLFSNIKSSSPSDYVQAAVLAREVGNELLARLSFMSLTPRTILDVSCAAGNTYACLQARYPDACVLALDDNFSMVHYAKQANTIGSHFLCANAERIPLADQSVDLIFSNLVLPFHGDYKTVLKEWRRVLAPQGLLMMTALGPDTWRECSTDCRQAGPGLIDMHEVGDLLLAQGFADPVLDVDYYTMRYRDKNKLIDELYQSNMLSQPITLDNLNTMPDSNGNFQLTYEIIHAHAFVPALTNEVSASEDGVVRIALSHLRKQLKSDNT